MVGVENVFWADGGGGSRVCEINIPLSNAFQLLFFKLEH